MRRECAVLAFVAAGLLLGAAALAQQVRELPLQGNPYRDVGGSCVYGGKGELLHAPAGRSCPDRSTHASSEAAHGASGSTGAEVAGLLDTHEHFAKDVLAVRQAIEAGQKQRALDALDHLSAGLIQHWAREGQLLKKVESQPAPSPR